MNILIVDDNKVIRTIIIKYIKQYFTDSKYKDFKLYEADDGDIALELIKENTLDIIFLDMSMPKMSGEEVLDFIRENKKYKDIYIIMVTAEDLKRNVLRLMEKGITGYIVKPFQRDSVFKALNKTSFKI